MPNPVCECGGRKHPYAKRCKACYLKGRESNVRLCLCGNKLDKNKNKGNMCLRCKQGNKIPVDRVQPIVNRLVEERDFLDWNDEGAGGKQILAQDVGLNQRQIHVIQRGEYKNTTESVVDQILMRTGNWHLWYTSPEDGGLGDYYSSDPPPPATEKGKNSKKLRTHRLKPYCACGREIKSNKRNVKQCIVCYRSKQSEGRSRYHRQNSGFFVKHP
jgi:hypothetical protein